MTTWTCVLATVPLIFLADPAPTRARSPGDDLGKLTIRELLARMPDSAWQKDGDTWVLAPVPAEMQRRLENGGLSAEDWREALLAGDVIHTRPRWPVGEPLVVWIHETPWLRYTRIRARAVQPDLGVVEADNRYPSMCGNCAEWDLDRQRSMHLDRVLPKTRRVEFEVEIDQRDPPEYKFGGEAGERRLWSGRLSIPLKAAWSLEQVMPSSASPAESDALVRSFHASWWTTPDGKIGPQLGLRIGDRFETSPALRGLAISLHVSLMHGGVEMAAADLVGSQGEGWNDRTEGVRGYAYLETTPEELRATNANLRGWDLRVTGTSHDVLTLWEADRWWSGEFTVSLEHALKPVELR